MGRVFETFLINEIRTRLEYSEQEYALSYLRTKDGAEIDLIIERPGVPLVLIEIKSTTQVGPKDVAVLNNFSKEFGHVEAYCFSQDEKARKIDAVSCLPWQQGVKELGI